MGQNKRRQSPKKDRYYDANQKQDLRDKKAAATRRRAHAERIIDRRCCRNPEVRKGFGAVVIALAVLTLIIGIIMTVVDATDNGKRNKYPGIFSVIGPLLIVLAVTLLIVGVSLSTPAVCNSLKDCLSFDDPKSFCRVHCPRLSHFLKPDDRIIISQHAMKALQTEPGKSVLRRHPPPDPEQPALTDQPNGEATSQNSAEATSLDLVPEVQYGYGGRPRLGSNKGVRFSESDLDGVRYSRHSSISSACDSVVSLKQCKVHPKQGIWWTADKKSQHSQESDTTNDVFTTTAL